MIFVIIVNPAAHYVHVPSSQETHEVFTVTYVGVKQYQRHPRNIREIPVLFGPLTSLYSCKYSLCKVIREQKVEWSLVTSHQRIYL